jgi:hypothetical protein
MTTADSDGRASLRDVYAAQQQTRTELGEVREELAGKVDRVAGTLDEIKDGILPRLAVVEHSQSDHHIQLVNHEGRLTVLETAHERALGHLGAWKVGGGLVAGAATIVLGDVVMRWIGG